MDQGKILITEDEESLRFVLQKALESDGYFVQTAANGASARRLLAEHHFDVSLMDIKLPDMSGMDVFQQIHEKSRSCRVTVRGKPKRARQVPFDISRRQ